MWKAFLSFLVLYLIVACGEKPTICDCMKKSIDINKELLESKNDEKKIKSINDRNEETMADCNEFIGGLSASDKEEMAREAKDCEYYPEFMKLFEVDSDENNEQYSTKF